MAVVAVLLIHMDRKAVGNMNPNIRNLPVISHRITFNSVTKQSNNLCRPEFFYGKFLAAGSHG